MELSIIMPCLNEAETIGACIDKAQRYLAEAEVVGEVVIGDNGSTDGSQAIAREHGARVVDVPVRGYGAALNAASREAQGKYIIMGDSDNSYDFYRLGAFVERLRAGDDLVMGNRFLGEIKPGAMPWKNRYIGNPILSGIGRTLFSVRIRDFHCGIRGYSKEAFERMELRTLGMEFASEMVIKATLLKMRITEVPTTLWPDGRSRPPHLRPWRDGWRHLRFMMLYSPRWLFLYPGFLLVGMGLLVGGYVLPQPRTLFGVTFDVHTLLMASASILIGFQAICFALFTKIFAIIEQLLPRDPKLEIVFKYINLEKGLVAGILMLLAGLGLTLAAAVKWKNAALGPLDPSQVLRILIPGTTLLMLGFQMIWASFFFSILGLKRK